MIKEIKNIKGETDENATVGTGTTVTLETDETFTIELFGDVDGNGKITSSDAQIAFEKAFNKEADDLRCADISGTSGVTSGDAQAIFDLAFAYKDEGKQGYVAEGKMPEETYVAPEITTYTVNLVDTKHNTTTPIETNAEGKIITDKLPDLSNYSYTENDIKYRVSGWSTKSDAKVGEEVDFDTLVVENDTNLYAIWTPDAKATIKLHYNVKNDQGIAEDKVVELEGEFKAADIIDLNDEKIEKATYTSDSSTAVTYTQSGWHKSNDSTLLQGEYQIPATKNNTAETIDLYPAWEVETTSIGEVNNTNVTTILDEIKTLQKNDKKYCGNLTIDSKVNLSTNLNLNDYKGITLTFKNEVELGANAEIQNAAEGVIKKVNDGKIVKMSNITATVIESNLNNKLYDIVKLNANATGVNADVTINPGTDATLDLNGHTLTTTSSKTFKIAAKNGDTPAGKLTIINSKDVADISSLTTAGKVTLNKAIENNGELIIGDVNAGRKLANNIQLTSTTDNCIDNKNDGTLTIKSGEILGSKASGDNASTINEGVIKNENGGTVIIEGGLVDANVTANKLPALLNQGKATITGGELRRSKQDTSTSNGFNTIINEGEMTIKGGTFGQYSAVDGTKKTKSAKTALIENGFTTPESVGTKVAKLDIYGGTFDGGEYIVSSNYGGKTTVTGGNYEAVGTSTSSVFRSIGEIEIDLSDKTAEECKINLGNTKTNLVSLGDKTKTGDQQMMYAAHKASLTIHPFDPSIVTTGKAALTSLDEVANKVVVEKDSGNTNIGQSELIAYIKADDAKEAGEQLMTVIKNSIAKHMTGASAEKNTVKIILDSEVEIEKGLDTDPGYDKTAENTILDLNGHSLTIHQLAIFNKNVTVQDGSTEKTGTIILDSASTENKPLTIFKKGAYAQGVDLSALAGKEN